MSLTNQISLLEREGMTMKCHRYKGMILNANLNNPSPLWTTRSSR